MLLVVCFALLLQVLLECLLKMHIKIQIIRPQSNGSESELYGEEGLGICILQVPSMIDTLNVVKSYFCLISSLYFFM